MRQATLMLKAMVIRFQGKNPLVVLVVLEETMSFLPTTRLHPRMGPNPPPPPPPPAPSTIPEPNPQPEQQQQQPLRQSQEQPQPPVPVPPPAQAPSTSHELQSQQSAVDSILSNSFSNQQFHSQDTSIATTLNSQSDSQPQPQPIQSEPQPSPQLEPSNSNFLYPPIQQAQQTDQPVASTSQLPIAVPPQDASQDPQQLGLPPPGTEPPKRGRGRGRGSRGPRGSRGSRGGRGGRPPNRVPGDDDEGQALKNRPVRSAYRNREVEEDKISGLRNRLLSSSGNAPKLKLKMRQAGESGGQGAGPKTTPYMQGFDRELDSSDDENGLGLAFEEQLILRMPEGVENDKLKEMVRKRELGNKKAEDVELKFKGEFS